MQTYHDESNKLKKSFLSLVSISTNLYKNKPITPQLTKQLLEQEAYLIKKLNTDEIGIIISAISKIYKLNNPISLIDDIQNINNLNPIIERINFILNEELVARNISNIKDPLAMKLTRALTTIFTCKNEFECNLRDIYLDLLEKHLSSSDGMSDDYLKYLHNINKVLKFKYPKVWYQDISTNDQGYEEVNIKTSYLHQKIEEVIKCLLKYKDEELDIDICYAKAISLQIYLRSLLIILDNEYEMISYEEMYNTLEPNETIAKRIVRNAFIANFIDTYEYTLDKKGE